jgi:hypothetical protein
VGTVPLTYQWQHDGTNIPSATTASLVLNNIAASNAGSYALTVANPLGRAISAAAYINLPPVAANSTAATIQNRPISIPVEKLLLLATDPNGDPVSLSGVNSTSTNGGSVALSGGVVTYTPATDYIGADRFSYTLSDGRGGTAAANVFVSVLTGNAQSQNLLAPLYTPGGLLVRFAGIVGRTYSVQRAPAVTGPWVTIGTATVGPTGIASFEDSSQLPGSAYYRTAYP